MKSCIFSREFGWSLVTSHPGRLSLAISGGFKGAAPSVDWMHFKTCEIFAGKCIFGIKFSKFWGERALPLPRIPSLNLPLSFPIFSGSTINALSAVALLARNIWGHGPMASAVARACGLGVEPPVGSRAEFLVRESRRQSPPEAEALLVFGCSVEAANFFYNLEMQRNQIFVLSLQKSWVATKLGAVAKLEALPARA